MDIRFEDGHLIVAYKPYGVLSEESDYAPNMPELLRFELGLREIYTVHRLDRSTQGLMIYAKTREAAKRLSVMMQIGGLTKIYLAAVEGSPDPDKGEMNDLLYFDRQKNKSYVVNRERRGVKKSSLEYETVSTALFEREKVSMLRIRLLTGRTHQIRVQTASRGIPIVGDRRYGSRIKADDIALCSSQLSFTHPFSGEKQCFRYIPTDGVFAVFGTNDQ